MPQYQTPGVYVEEVERGPKPIEGVSTSVAGFLGETERGPTAPRLVTSFADFRRIFGGFTDSNLAYAVDGFFRNGGGRCYVGRVVPKYWLTDAPADSFGSVDLDAESDGGGGGGGGGEEGEEGEGGGGGGGGGGETPTALTVDAVGPGDWANGVVVWIDGSTLGADGTFRMTVAYFDDTSTVTDDMNYEEVKTECGEPKVEEVYDNLSLDPTSSNYVESRVDGVSNLVETELGDGGVPETDQLAVLSADPPETDDLGNEISVDADDYAGRDDAGDRTGIAAFKEIDEISMVCVPDENDHTGLRDEVVTHCATMKDRFAILQTERSVTPSSAASNRDSGTDSTYGALYYPWLKVLDPETNLEKSIPPGGHVAGIYARSDTQHGVHKAPANEIVRGVQELEFSVTKGEQASLNPKGVNCIRSFPGRGIRVWGARTVSSDPSWKYVNVRRLFLYLEESIDEGTQWVVFESNDEDTWARVRQSVRNFLTGAWEDGALMGATPEEAFYVKCDRSTMSQDDIDNGRLICEIGVAPVKPAEFVIFRIAQWTGGGE